MWRSCKLLVSRNISCGRSASYAGTVAYGTEGGTAHVTIPLCTHHGQLIAGRLELGIGYRMRGTMQVTKVWPLAHIATARQPKTR